MTTAKQIADWFLTTLDRDSGNSITQLKLQKLVYYSQAWALVLLDRELFSEDFQAWTHGPVLRSLYDEHCASGWESLGLPEDGELLDDKEICKLLSDISESYGMMQAKQLEELTHKEDPWVVARGGIPLEARTTAVITKESMKVYYTARYNELDGEE